MYTKCGLNLIQLQKTYSCLIKDLPKPEEAADDHYIQDPTRLLATITQDDLSVLGKTMPEEQWSKTTHIRVGWDKDTSLTNRTFCHYCTGACCFSEHHYRSEDRNPTPLSISPPRTG